MEYNLDFHTRKVLPILVLKFLKLRQKIMKLTDVSESYTKTSVIYKTKRRNFVRFEFYKKSIKILFFNSELFTADIDKFVRPTKNEWGSTALMKFVSALDIDYIFKLIKESYESIL